MSVIEYTAYKSDSISFANLVDFPSIISTSFLLLFVQHQLLLLFISVLCFMTTTGKNQLATLYAYTHTPHNLCWITSGSATSCGNNGPFKCIM